MTSWSSAADPAVRPWRRWWPCRVTGSCCWRRRRSRATRSASRCCRRPCTASAGCSASPRSWRRRASRSSAAAPSAGAPTRSRGRSPSRSPRSSPAPTSFAYQVERMQVRPDPAGQRAAARASTSARTCRSPTSSTRATGSPGVRFTDADGAEREVARPLSSSTPRATRAGSTTRVGGERNYSDFFRNLALFGYFEGGKRLPAPNQGNILCRRLRRGLVLVHPALATTSPASARSLPRDARRRSRATPRRRCWP